MKIIKCVLKECSTMLEIVIEIGKGQTWLFQCTLFHYADKIGKPQAIVEQRIPISMMISSTLEHPYYRVAWYRRSIWFCCSASSSWRVLLLPRRLRYRLRSAQRQCDAALLTAVLWHQPAAEVHPAGRHSHPVHHRPGVQQPRLCRQLLHLTSVGRIRFACRISTN